MYENEYISVDYNFIIKQKIIIHGLKLNPYLPLEYKLGDWFREKVFPILNHHNQKHQMRQLQILHVGGNQLNNFCPYLIQPSLKTKRQVR